jgi:hypothetical protein
MPRNILLMTATITPLPGIPVLARTDPKARLQDYQASLAFYSGLLGGCFDAIIFAENSNSDVSSLIAASKKRGHFDSLEFISFYGLDYEPKHGRGYGEFRLVDHVVSTSKLLRSDDVIWKVTGRYIVKNIERIVASRPPASDLYCHLRNYPYRMSELYLMAWTRRGYEALIKGIYPKLSNDIIPGKYTVEETLFREAVDRASGTTNIVPRFKVVPVVQGVQGWDNRQFSNPWSIKIAGKRIANILIPSLWI